MKKIILVAMTLLCVVACDQQSAQENTEVVKEQTAEEKIAEIKAKAPSFETGSLSIKTADNETHKFNIEFAKTVEQKAYGLMFRKSLSKDYGMLFTWEGEPKTVSFWMKNTFVPLDMLFIDKDKKILSIAKMAKPLSEEHIPSGGDVIAVLEVMGGTADKLGINVGDTVEWEEGAWPVVEKEKSKVGEKLDTSKLIHYKTDCPEADDASEETETTKK